MEKIIASFENTYDELFVLESIIILTKEACLEKEFGSVYYNLPAERQTILSEERNHYINMLTIALDKVSKLKAIVSLAENEICYLQ